MNKAENPISPAYALVVFIALQPWAFLSRFSSINDGQTHLNLLLKKGWGIFFLIIFWVIQNEWYVPILGLRTQIPFFEPVIKALKF